MTNKLLKGGGIVSKKKFKLGDGYIDILVQFTQNNDKVITQDTVVCYGGS